MPKPTGMGTNMGYLMGGGSLIRIYSPVPDENGFIPLDDFIRFTVGVEGSLIKLDTVRIEINSELAFDGTIPGYVGLYSGSSDYIYIPANNGYRFNIKRSFAYPDAVVPVHIVAETTDGGGTDQTYNVKAFSTPVYPPVALDAPYGNVPLDAFSGEADSGLLAGAQGLVFFSPSLTRSSNSNQVDFNFIELVARPKEVYTQPDVGNIRPFLSGPPFAVPPPSIFPPQYNATYFPVLNGNYTLMGTTKRNVIGVLFDTTFFTSTQIIY